MADIAFMNCVMAKLVITNLVITKLLIKKFVFDYTTETISQTGEFMTDIWM
jgi:hypothetical protein